MIRRFRYLGIAGVSFVGVFTAKCAIDKFKSTVVAADVDESENNSGELVYQLKQVQVFFRHGARTPVRIMPNVQQASFDPQYVGQKLPFTVFDYEVVYPDGSPIHESVYDKHYSKVNLKGGCKGGMLTSFGQYQVYRLGLKLKREYMDKHSLITDYNPETVFIRSTNMKRTVESLRCVMAGLFGANNLRQLGSLKIPVHHSSDEYLFPNPYVCPVLRVINHAAVIHGVDMDEFVDQRLEVEKALGIDSKNGDKKMNFIDARDTFICRMVHGLDVPKGALQHWTMIQDNATKLMFYAICGQLEAERFVATRLSGGKMMDLILQNLINAGKSSTKMYLYSAHDTTLMTLLALLDTIDWRWPPFASDIRFELYERSDGTQYVKVLYEDKPLKVRGCNSEMCPLQDFIKSLRPYSIKDEEYKDICNSNILEEIAKEVLEKEKGEVEDEEMKERSDVAAGL